MFWFVNPYNPNKAINLVMIGSLATKKNMLYLDNHTWMFEDDAKAKEVYEQIVKLVQQYRYRKKD